MIDNFTTTREFITLRNVAKTYLVDRRRTVPAVCDVSLDVNRGDFLIITGRSGSGKTTLLNIMAGLTTPTAGEVRYNGVEVWKLPDGQQSLFRNQHVGFVFQFPSLMPSLTVLENVLLPTTFFAQAEDIHTPTARAIDLLSEIGLADKLSVYPRQLSAGQQQRVVIARALMREPEVLFADEPTSDLDEQTEHEIMGLFQDVHRRLGVTIVLVTHSTELRSYGSRALHMVAGQLSDQTLDVRLRLNLPAE